MGVKIEKLTDDEIGYLLAGLLKLSRECEKIDFVGSNIILALYNKIYNSDLYFSKEWFYERFE